MSEGTQRAPRAERTVGTASAVGLGGLRERVPRALRLGTRVYFLGAVFLVFALYTETAFGLEWSTEAGRIGPGFFPRIIGALGMVATLFALYRELRGEGGPTDDEDAAEGTDTRHPMAVLYLMLAAVMLAYWFLLLGAVLSGALFLGVVLWFLDPAHRVRALVLGVAMPVGMYLLFQTALNAGLPDGILPMP